MDDTRYALKDRGGVFYAVWTENSRSMRRSMRTGDEALARERMAEMAAELSGKRSPKVGQLWDEKYADASDAMRTRARSVWSNLSGRFGGMDADKVSADDVRGYVRDALRERSEGTVHLEVSMLMSALRHGLGRDNVPNVRLPKKSAPRSRHLTAEESALIQAKLDEAGEFSRGAMWFRIAMATGARKQAILDLTWARVDLENRLVNLLPEGERQTSKRRPVVRIPRSLAEHLSRAPRTGERVVPDGSGKVDNEVGRACRMVGVEGFHPHVTRHTVATRLVSAGIPLFEVAKTLGCTVGVIERTYAHLAPDHGESSARVLE